MTESLYVIEQSLQLLVDERDRAEANGDSEAIATIDRALTEYLTREAAKIDSYAGLIHQLDTEAELVKAEADRLHGRAKAMLARNDAIKAAALVAMQAHGVKELKTYRNTLRRQGNGGLQALEIAQLGAVPMEYRTVKSYSRCRNTETDGFGCIAQPADGAIAPAEEGEGYVQSWDRVIMQRGSL